MAGNDKDLEITHIESRAVTVDIDADKAIRTVGHDTAGLAIIEQQTVIPQTGDRIPTSKWEYLTFLIFYFQINGSPVGSQGGSLRMKLMTMAFPDGFLHWGGKRTPINSYLLDINGIIFAVNLVMMLVMGACADYGTWRPMILMCGTALATIATFALIGITQPHLWQVANGLVVVGSLGYNLSVTFYQATFPSLARNLPEVLKSEQEVLQGIKTPEEHDFLDQYERSKLYNLSNITGSALVVIFYAVAIGISWGVTHNSTADDVVIKAYQVLLGYFGALILLCCVPFFLVQRFRPGQDLPEGKKIWQVGPTQVWRAVKDIRHLKHALLYLIAYALISEAAGTQWGITSLLQAEHINFDPVKNSAFNLLGDVAGGTGTVIVLLLQKRFKIKIRSFMIFGGCAAIGPIIWGGLGLWTTKIGFHNTWEFYVLPCWNLLTAAWGSYAITMISEVVPAPKVYLFFALFNTISRTSGFTGPFICSAIISRANGNSRVAYWFLVGLGALGVFFACLVNVEQAKIDNAKFLEREAKELYSDRQRAEQAQRVELETVAVIEKS